VNDRGIGKQDVEVPAIDFIRALLAVFIERLRLTQLQFIHVQFSQPLPGRDKLVSRGNVDRQYMFRNQFA
jgi:hypothetical protein